MERLRCSAAPPVEMNHRRQQKHAQIAINGENAGNLCRGGCLFSWLYLQNFHTPPMAVPAASTRLGLQEIDIQRFRDDFLKEMNQKREQ